MGAVVEAKLKISATEQTAKAFNAVERRLKRVERLTQIANRQQRQMAAFEAASARASKALLLGGTALMGGFAAAGGVRAGLATLTSYEDALIEIRKKGGLTADQMHAIGKEAMALATSGEIAVPLDEILAAYERAAAAGLPMDEWREFAKLSAKAADAFGMAAEDVGNAAAGFKVGLGIPMSEMERYFDLINSLADSGIADESDLIKFIDNAGAGLKVFGLNAKEAAAYGATLLNLKLGPETGARMMNALTSKLIAPENLGKKAYAAFHEVVGDVKAFKKELKSDPSGALRQFLGQLAKMDKFKRAQLTGAIFGMEWSDEIARLISGLDELDRNQKMAAGNDWFGSLGKSYQARLEALSAQWQLFKNDVSQLTVQLGTMAMPGMEAGLEKARDLVKQIGEEIATFELKLDKKEIGEAQEALDRMLVSINELLGIDGSSSFVASFFRDIATMVNEIAAGIKLIEKFTNPQAAITILPPDELARRKAEYDAKTKKDGQSWTGWFQDAFGIGGGDGPTPTPSFNDIRQNQDALLANPFRHDEPPPSSTQQMLDNGPLRINYGGIDQSPAAPLTGGMNMQFGSGPNVDALRQAMEAGSGAITQAGSDAGSTIESAAQAIRDAAATIGDQGREAAAAISAAKISVPSIPGGSRAPNANLGTSMPNAGTPGG